MEKMSEVYKEFEDRDFNDLKEMIFGLYHEDPLGEPITEDKIVRTVSESKAHPEKIRIFMICRNGIAIGYGIIVFFWSNEFGGNIIHLDELYVKKEYRNKGVASNFIRFLTEAYGNAASLNLETTPSNTAALRLYKKLGFETLPNVHLALRLNKD
jgi:ribosomal protein S18 acetylase RimI-like enzyme